MNRWPVAVLALLAPFALAADPAPGPLPAEQAAKQSVLPDGFRMSVFAAEPLVTQPVSFCLDHRGRVWVAEALNYGAWQPTGKDRVAILEDTDGDGRADKRTVVCDNFNYITGVEVGFGGVWVMSPPGLYFVPIRDDKPSGPPQLVLDGFGYKESRHNLANGFTWGPDGWLYGGHGRTSPSDVGAPGTPAKDRIHCDGGVYRVHPITKKFEVFADGTTNPWGVDFDDYGQCFVSNCVNPHLFHMIPGGHYEPWRNRPSSQYAYERLPTIADHLHYPGGDIRGTVGKAETLAMGGGHAHCGTLVYLGDAFPKPFRNTVLTCNVHGRRVNNDILKRKGSGYVASHGKDLMVSADPWFMGVTLRLDPGGSVLLSDWSDTGECHTYKPDMKTGRIYRISHGEPKLPNVDLSKLSDKELVELQTHPNEWQVRTARRLLQERSTGWTDLKREAVRRSLFSAGRNHPEVTRRLRALWTLHAIGEHSPVTLTDLLADPAEHVRGWAVRLLCEARDPRVDQLVVRATVDPSPVVRLELAAALQRLRTDQRWSLALALLARAEDATDANLPLMIWYGFEPLVPADPERALDVAAKGQIPLVRQFAARRFLDHAATVGAKADLSPLAKVLAEAPPAAVPDLLRGAREGIKGRRNLPMPAGWPAVYAKLRDHADNQVRDNAVSLALAFGDPRAVTDLRALAADQAAPPADRAGAVESLVGVKAADLAPLLFDLLPDPATRRAAVRGLAAYPHPDTAAKVLAAYPRFDAGDKADAVATLAARRDTALSLLGAVEAKRVPRADVSAFAARQMFALNDAAVRDRLKQVWGEVRPTAGKPEVLAKYRAMLTPAYLRSADAASGKAVYARTCQACHKLNGQGTDIGPNLNGVNRGNLDYWLTNLTDPGAEVGKDYRMSVVRTVDGRVVSGIVVERSAARVVVQTATERVTLAADDVEGVADSPLSLMPEGQLDALRREDVRDLIAYLMGG
ncbi:PVC-type heme-binding CxxCH protein [Urbifossiella limnaea]|uniref:Cytochrome c n=1 Tax=Urbifossiella limnaea TaxID=2528023 RepID=A0A517XZJ5_9BACT|nr:PVC-type heme-binding CxxCH protein [Urbifossiella limnaea]QDU22931.1 Cytochrome c [Urbifossiella limnaea]